MKALITTEQTAAAWIAQPTERAIAMAQQILANRTKSQAVTPSPSTAQIVLDAFRRLAARPYAYNQVSLADLAQEAVLGLPALHAGINDLRRRGVLTLSGYEGRHGADPRIVNAAIRENGEILAYAHERLS